MKLFKSTDDTQQSVKDKDPWWVIALKVLSYVIGLVLAGAATTGCSSMVLAML